MGATCVHGTLQRHNMFSVRKICGDVDGASWGEPPSWDV
jgi:hypothetical protein